MNITKDDIPYKLYFMVDIIDYENFLEVCRVYGSEVLYIQMYKNVIMGQRYNGRNIDDLSAMYGISYHIIIFRGR